MELTMSMFATQADYWKAQAEKAQREAADWRQNFDALQRALVGETGASGITAAAALHKDAERYRWLTADHHKHATRARVYSIALSFNTHGKGAVDAAIDAELALLHNAGHQGREASPA